MYVHIYVAKKFIPVSSSITLYLMYRDMVFYLNPEFPIKASLGLLQGPRDSASEDRDYSRLPHLQDLYVGDGDFHSGLHTCVTFFSLSLVYLTHLPCQCAYIILFLTRHTVFQKVSVQEIWGEE